MLDSYQFQCLRCLSIDNELGSQVQSYQKHCEHISSSCPCSLRCPFMCDTDILFTRDELDNHITVCPNAIVTCPKCGMEIMNKESPDHDCIEFLKNIIFQKNLVIEKLE